MSVERACFRAVVAIVIVSSLSGCKSGTSFAKPSWWTFGGAGTPDAEKLAAAPPYTEGTAAADGQIPKPSSTATPYPTTTTPQGYVVAGSTPASPGSVATQSPTASDAPITYGKTPPAVAEVTPPPSPVQPAAAAAAPIAAGIAPQAGPYASLPTPAAPPAAAPAAVPPMAEAGLAQPAARIADTRMPESFGSPAAAPPPSSSFAAPPSAAAPASSSGIDSRYGTANGSRFSGEPSAAPAAIAPPASGFAAPPSAPAAAPASLPSAPPTRRPDPGYRPGGTSSYRPSKTILVGDPAAESAVRTAAFETPAEPIRQ